MYPVGSRRVLGDRDHARAGEELAGQRVGHRFDLRRRALRDEAPAVHARAGPEVDELVGGAHRLLVVLDDDHGVPELAQALERRDELRVVAHVEPDRWLVEDVEHADERGADLRRETDALRLAARERRRGAVHREVASKTNRSSKPHT